MKINYVLQLLLLLLIYTYQQQSQYNLGSQNKVKQRILKQIPLQKSIYLELSHEQVMFKPIKQLLKSIQFPQSFITPQISSLKNHRSNKKNSQICNIIRAPNHKPFSILDRVRHKIKNFTEWRSIIAQETVIYKLEDIQKFQFALDIEVIDNKIVVLFEDGEVIFFVLQNGNKVKQIKRQWISKDNYNARLGKGKIYVSDKIGFFISSRQIVLINATEFTIKTVNNYQKSNNFFSAQLTKNQNKIHIYTANGKFGINHYIFNQNQKQLKKIGNFLVTFTQNQTSLTTYISVIDIIEVTNLVKHTFGQQIFLILNPKYGILKLTIPSLGQFTQTKSASTNMQISNCRMMKLHNSLIYASCPQIITYNPKNNKIQNNPILMQLPIQLLSNGTDITFISHNSFQMLDPCSGATFQGNFAGEVFHHTTVLNDYFVSVDDISVTLWKMTPPQYFLACRPNNKFIGKNDFNLTINSLCQTGECCSQQFAFDLYIYNSNQGLHALQAIIGSIIVVVTAIAFIVLYVKKHKLNTQYSQLMQQAGTKQKANNLSMIEQTQPQNILQTEQAIIDQEKQGKKQEQNINEHVIE